MEAILGLPTSTSAEASSRSFSPWLHPGGGVLRQNRHRHRPSLLLHFDYHWDGGRRRCPPLVVEAKKKNRGVDRNVNKVPSPHPAIPTPGELTGYFPEAVLLKKKVVREDGRFLPEFADAEEEERYEFLTLQRESALNLQQLRHYEIVYLIHEDNFDDVESINSKVQDFIKEKKGRIYRLNDWGLRTLAYKIKKANKANYILMNFELEAKSINDFKDMLDKDERIIRHLVMKRKEAISEPCPPPPEYDTIRRNMMDDDDEGAIVNVDDDEDDEDDEYDDDDEEYEGEDDEEYEDEDDEEYDDEDDEEYDDEDDEEYDDEDDEEYDDDEEYHDEDEEYNEEDDAEHADKDGVVGKDNAFVGKDNAFVGKDNAFVGKDNAFVGKDNAFVDKDEQVASPKGSKTLSAKKR